MPHTLRPHGARVFQRAGAPIYWPALDGGRRTFPGDAGDLADRMGTFAASSRHGSSFVAGPSGAALSTSPTAYATGPSFTLPASWTVFARVVPRVATQAGYARIAVTEAGSEWFIGASPEGARYYGIVAGNDVIGAGSLTPGIPQNVTLTYDGAAKVARLYQDATLLATTGTLATGPTGTRTVYLATDVNAIGTGGWDGLIEDFRFYDYKLTADDVAREYDDPWWRLRAPRRRSVVIGPIYPTVGSRMIRRAS